MSTRFSRCLAHLVADVRDGIIEHISRLTYVFEQLVVHSGVKKLEVAEPPPFTFLQADRAHTTHELAGSYEEKELYKSMKKE